MRVLLDGSSMQVHAHRESGGLRLRDLIEDLRSRLHAEVVVGDDQPLLEQGLSDVDVLVIPTRDSRYPLADLEAVKEFVDGGGGLLLLTNHADVPGLNAHNCAKFDAALAAAFGLVVEEAFFTTGKTGVLTVMDVPSSEHPAVRGAAGVVRSIAVGNCTSLLASDRAVGLVPLPSDAVDIREGRPAAGRFAVLAAECGLGRVILCGDSGLCGSWETLLPGPGFLHLADNRALLLNAVAWLASPQADRV